MQTQTQIKLLFSNRSDFYTFQQCVQSAFTFMQSCTFLECYNAVNLVAKIMARMTAIAFSDRKISFTISANEGDSLIMLWDLYAPVCHEKDILQYNLMVHKIEETIKEIDRLKIVYQWKGDGNKFPQIAN